MALDLTYKREITSIGVAQDHGRYNLDLLFLSNRHGSYHATMYRGRGVTTLGQDEASGPQDPTAMEAVAVAGSAPSVAEAEQSVDEAIAALEKSQQELQDASAATIKKAYYKLARTNHREPDAK